MSNFMRKFFTFSRQNVKTLLCTSPCSEWDATLTTCNPLLSCGPWNMSGDAKKTCKSNLLKRHNCDACRRQGEACLFLESCLYARLWGNRFEFTGWIYDLPCSKLDWGGIWSISQRQRCFLLCLLEEWKTWNLWVKAIEKRKGGQ